MTWVSVHERHEGVPPRIAASTSLLSWPVQVKWLAFEDVIDWGTIALVIHRDAMADIPALVATTDVEVLRVLS